MTSGLLGTTIARVRKFSGRLSGPVTLLLLGQLVTATSAFLVNLISARALPPDSRGLLALYVQLAYLLTTALLFGVERPYNAAIRTSFSHALHDLNVLTRGRRLLFATVAAAFIVSTLLGEWTFLLPALLITVYAAGNIWIRFFRVAYISSSKRRPYLTSVVLVQLLLLAASLALAFVGVDSVSIWFGAYASTTVVVLIYGRVLVHRTDEKKSISADLEQVRRQGWRALPASFGNTALLKSDRLLLPALASPAELGVYVVVATVLELAVWPLQQWADATMHRWRSTDRMGRRRIMFRAVMFSTVATAACATLAVVAVTTFLPDSYLPSLSLIPALAVGSLLYGVTRVQQGLLLANGHAGRVSAVETAGMAVSLMCYVILIPAIGAQGAAIGSAAGYGACSLGAWLASRGT